MRRIGIRERNLTRSDQNSDYLLLDHALRYGPSQQYPAWRIDLGGRSIEAHGVWRRGGVGSWGECGRAFGFWVRPLSRGRGAQGGAVGVGTGGGGAWGFLGRCPGVAGAWGWWSTGRVVCAFGGLCGGVGGLRRLGVVWACRALGWWVGEVGALGLFGGSRDVLGVVLPMGGCPSWGGGWAV